MPWSQTTSLPVPLLFKRREENPMFLPFLHLLQWGPLAQMNLSGHAMHTGVLFPGHQYDIFLLCLSLPELLPWLAFVSNTGLTSFLDFRVISSSVWPWAKVCEPTAWALSYEWPEDGPIQGQFPCLMGREQEAGLLLVVERDQEVEGLLLGKGLRPTHREVAI